MLSTVLSYNVTGIHTFCLSFTHTHQNKEAAKKNLGDDADGVEGALELDHVGELVDPPEAPSADQRLRQPRLVAERLEHERHGQLHDGLDHAAVGPLGSGALGRPHRHAVAFASREK